jgi:predicted ATP-grasp superfamily ATP-dependent carboligase
LDVLEQSLVVINMAEFGYRGVVGIDYIVSDEGIFPVENNARFNASSYVSMIVDNIEKLTPPIPCENSPHISRFDRFSITKN